MPTFETFSKRTNPKVNGVYEYNVIPDRFRGQLVHILRDLTYYDIDVYKIHETFCRELGKNYLKYEITKYHNEFLDIELFIKKTSSNNDLLDLIDIFCIETNNLLQRLKKSK